LIRISRRLERLEARAAVAKRPPHRARIVFVDPEKGATTVLVIETGKPMIEVPPTPEEVERVRADLEQRRASRQNRYGS
jgi:hypothetical protein